MMTSIRSSPPTAAWDTARQRLAAARDQEAEALRIIAEHDDAHRAQVAALHDQASRLLDQASEDATALRQRIEQLEDALDHAACQYGQLYGNAVADVGIDRVRQWATTEPDHDRQQPAPAHGAPPRRDPAHLPHTVERRAR